MLSLAFLTGALRARGGLTVGRLTGVTVEAQWRANSGATVARLALGYDAAAPISSPRRVVAKIAEGDALDPSRRELRFYRLIAPSIPEGLAPRLFGAAVGLEEGKIVLLFEDLLESGYVQAIGPLTKVDLETLVDRMAALHAVFWGKSWPPELDFSAPMTSSTRSAQAAPLAVVEDNARTGNEAMSAFLSRYQSQLSLQEEAVLTGVQSRWHDDMAARSCAGHLTLIHGDFHLAGNIFLRDDAPPRVIDWSEMKPGLGPHDLAYALISQPVENRVARDLVLLERYHAALETSGVTGYSWDQCLWDYRFSLVTNLFQSARQSNLIWMRKTLAAIADHDATASILAQKPGLF